MKLSYYIVFILAAFLSAGSVFSVEELAPVEVFAGKEAAPYFFGSSHHLSREELAREALPSLMPALEKVPGLVITQNGGPGGRTSFFIRGTESRHVSFTIDGLKLNDPSNTDRQFDAAFLTMPFLKQVRVHHGPQAVVYGSDAMGGLVEMVTRKGEEAPLSRVSFSAGSFDTYAGSASQDWKKNNHQGTVSAVHMRTEGISRLNEKRFDATERDGSKTNQLTSSSRHQWNKKARTDLLLSYIHGTNELDGFNADTDDESRNDQYLLQQKSSYLTNSQMEISLRNGLSRHQRNAENAMIGERNYSGHLLQNELLLQWKKNTYSFLQGFAHEHEEAQFEGINPETDLYSLFSQGLLKVAGISFQAGLRAERHTRYGNFLTGSAGVKYSWDKQGVSLQHSRGYKAPSLYQIYGPPIFGNPVANPDLRPEINEAWEFRWEREGELIETSVSLFENNLENLFVLTNQGYRNQAAFSARGVEASLTFKQESWLARLTGTHQDFLDEEGAILRRPYNLAQVQGSWFLSETQELFARLKWLDARRDFDENGNVLVLSAYETVELGFKQNWGRHEASLQVFNLLDREYEEIYGASVLPRSYFASYAYSF